MDTPPSLIDLAFPPDECVHVVPDTPSGPAFHSEDSSVFTADQPTMADYMAVHYMGQST